MFFDINYMTIYIDLTNIYQILRLPALKFNTKSISKVPNNTSISDILYAIDYRRLTHTINKAHL